jgi:hypothetical protein
VSFADGGAAFASDGGYAPAAAGFSGGFDAGFDGGAYGGGGYDGGYDGVYDGGAPPGQQQDEEEYEGWAGSPAGETPSERRARMARSRSLLDRAFSRSASERLDAIMARPDFLPPEMRSTAPGAPLAAG